MNLSEIFRWTDQITWVMSKVCALPSALLDEVSVLSRWFSASEALATMRYINWCFTYLLTLTSSATTLPLLSYVIYVVHHRAVHVFSNVMLISRCWRHLRTISITVYVVVIQITYLLSPASSFWSKAEYHICTIICIWKCEPAAADFFYSS